MPLPLGNQTVTLVRRVRAGTDDYGEDVFTTERVMVEGCSFQPVSSAEQLGTADRVVTRYRLFAPPGTDLDAVDAVEVAGQSWEVDGDAENWPDLAGAAHHVECYLRKVEG
ncbi:hypothetical protein [Kutzneria chonburiensis]|uniref:Head-tail adaptor protein n=1 Tax=Kutzneria chonburiensis TaxID=1483604 RepID=A0ABV6N3G3_9PSEU|nr:hypothetical protein [Kutzneria chonburiensis]